MPEGRNRIAVRAPRELVAAAELVAQERGVTLSDVVRSGLREKVRRELGLDTEERHRERVPA